MGLVGLAGGLAGVAAAEATEKGQHMVKFAGAGECVGHAGGRVGWVHVEGCMLGTGGLWCNGSAHLSRYASGLRAFSHPKPPIHYGCKGLACSFSPPGNISCIIYVCLCMRRTIHGPVAEPKRVSPIASATSWVLQGIYRSEFLGWATSTN